MMDWQIIVAVVAAVAAPIGAYLLAARKTSGQVGTSEADELWTESRSIREDYRDRLNLANARITALESRLDLVEKDNTKLLAENNRLMLVLNQRVNGGGSP